MSKIILLQGTLNKGLYQIAIPTLSTRHPTVSDSSIALNTVTDSNPRSSFSLQFTTGLETDEISKKKGVLSSCQLEDPNKEAYKAPAVSTACNVSVMSNDCTKDLHLVSRLWHMRLGHPNALALQTVLQHLNVKLSKVNKDFVCSACQYGKMHQSTYPLSNSKANAPLELVHSDLWGPAPVVSNEGFRYYVHFLDDYSRFVWLFPLKAKSETNSVFQQFHKLAETQFGTKIQTLQTDWGGEYRSLLPYLTAQGIHFRHPCPHTHQQNGRAERKHRQIVEIGLTLRFHALEILELSFSNSSVPIEQVTIFSS